SLHKKKKRKEKEEEEQEEEEEEEKGKYPYQKGISVWLEATRRNRYNYQIQLPPACEAGLKPNQKAVGYSMNSHASIASIDMYFLTDQQGFVKPMHIIHMSTDTFMKAKGFLRLPPSSSIFSSPENRPLKTI
ncbi:hypothetical protein STEG23_005020, partial [Scotinomys teguina]